MLIPIIKDFNNAFSYLVSGSAEKVKEMFGALSRNSGTTWEGRHLLASKLLPPISEGQSIASGTPEQAPLGFDIFQISWAGIRICFLFLVQALQYIVSFQWLRDFAYLPISIPTTTFHSSKTFWQAPDSGFVQKIWEGPNVLQRYLFSNQTVSTWMGSRVPENNLSIANSTAPLQGTSYNDFIMGSSHSEAPINSWSLSFLSSDWFDPLTVPINFLSSKNLSQFSSSLPGKIMSLGHSIEPSFWQDSNGIGINNIIIMSILICVATGFSSFFNSFFISFPLSLSNVLSLRYLIIQKFFAGCLSILGIVLGEIAFMLLLILPPPFIQITLVYLESVWPYIFGLSLIIFIIFDFLNNPYINTISFSQTSSDLFLQTSRSDGTPRKLGSPPRTQWNQARHISSLRDNNYSLLNILKAPYTKIFGFSFLLSLTEQSCCFSFFGSLNLSSTANFLDTYLFAASKSPIILFFSCIGFLIGSFSAILIYNLAIAKIIFLFTSYINRFSNKATILRRSFNETVFHKWSLPLSNINRAKNSTPTEKRGLLNVSNLLTNLRLSFDPKTFLVNLPSIIVSFFYSFGSWFFTFVIIRTKQILQFLIRYLPGGKRIFFFIFPGQATSYRSSNRENNASYAQASSDVSRQAKRWDEPKNRVKNRIIGRDKEGSGRLPRNTRVPILKFVSQNVLAIETNIENRLLKNGSDASLAKNKSDSNANIFTANEQNTEGKYMQGKVPTSSSTIGSSALYNKIDKILLTCLITLSFTTIPYYSFDYLINSFFGFIPQDQILNTHSLRVNFPDYTNLLGITLSDNNSVINTDVSLYDRAHFMYGEWPNSFESLNYQGEYMWTNLRDHRRQKRTRRSTRLKFKTLKTKISTSWKEFKRSSGFSGDSLREGRPRDPFSKNEDYQAEYLPASNWTSPNKAMNVSDAEKESNRFQPKSVTGNKGDEDKLLSPLSPEQDSILKKSTFQWNRKEPKNQVGERGIRRMEPQKPIHEKETVSSRNLRYSAWHRPDQVKSNNSDLFYKLFFGTEKPISPLSASSTYPSNTRQDNSIINKTAQEVYEPFDASNSRSSSGYLKGKNRESSSTAYRRDNPTSSWNLNAQEIFRPNMKKKEGFRQRSTRLSETIKPLSTSTFVDLSGGEKYIKTYPKNWKKAITEKYYQNPIYQTLLSTDLKNFLKREPLSHQLTNNQENELYFLRIKMAHYYDSLRFYFTLKDQINNTRPRPKVDRSRYPPVDTRDLGRDSALESQNTIKTKTKRENKTTNENLRSQNSRFKPKYQNAQQVPPLPVNTLLKSLPTSSPTLLLPERKEPGSKEDRLQVEYESWFVPDQKREFITDKRSVVKEPRFSLALPPFQFKSMTSMNYRQQFKGTLKTVKQLFAISLPSKGSLSSNSLQKPINSLGTVTDPIEKSYKYDKYLFNEYTYPKNEFLHEEAKNRKLPPTKFSLSNQSALSRDSILPRPRSAEKDRQSISPQLSSGNPKTNFIARTERQQNEGGIRSATKNIYNMFGSNDPFYVGWDQNLRKFVLTSRILTRASALNMQDEFFDSKKVASKNKQTSSSVLADKDQKARIAQTPTVQNRTQVPPDVLRQTKRSGEPQNESTTVSNKVNSQQKSVHIYRPYTSWPFFKHQLKNLPNRPYFVLYENYLNILNKRIHLFRNININDIDTKSLTYLYSYFFPPREKRYVSQLPINLYKQAMRPSSSENLFTPTSNARSSFLWPGSTMPAWEYYFW